MRPFWRTFESWKLEVGFQDIYGAHIHNNGKLRDPTSVEGCQPLLAWRKIAVRNEHVLSSSDCRCMLSTFCSGYFLAERSSRMSPRDRYLAILELGPGASLDEIKQAYRDLAQVWHPDRYPSNPRLRSKAEERFKTINDAYQKLIFEQPTYQTTTPPPAPTPRWQPESSSAPPQAAASGPSSYRDRPPRWPWLLVLLIPVVLILDLRKAVDPLHQPARFSRSDQRLAPAARPEEHALPRLPRFPAAPHLVQAVPEDLFKKLKFSFSAPAPQAHGRLQNDTEWNITAARVIIRRQFEQIVKDPLVVDPPAPDARRFEVKIVKGTILPYAAGDIEINLGRYLNPYQDRRWGNPPVEFRVAKTFLTIESVEGYLQ
jgi:hypothetical protein